jgi:regulator of RNase E activity RraA
MSAAIHAMLEKLALYDTPTICNVIELFEVRPRNRGFMDHRIRSAFPEFAPMVGYACTASFRSDVPPQGGNVYGSLQSQLETFGQLPGPAVVVFQDLDDPAVGATFGEVMCSTYKAFGARGLVTSGGGRDQIPHEIAAEVADISSEFIAAECIVMDYVKGPGEKSVAEFGERMKAMSAAMQQLRQRVSRKKA